MSEEQVRCSLPAATVGGEQEGTVQPEEVKKGGMKMGVTVGMKAPDFTAPAYFKGKFTTVKLSDR